MENPTPTENEEKVEITTPAAPAVEQTQEEPTAPPVVDDTTTPPASGSETTENNGIDYAGQLEAEIAKKNRQLEQAGHVIQKLKEEKKDPETPEAPKEEPQLLETPSVDLDTLVDQKVASHMQGLVADTVDMIAESLTDNEDERKLMVHYYENKVQKSGFTRAQIREDMELALAMANRAAITRENIALKDAVRTKNTIVNASRGSNQDRFEPAAPGLPLSEADKKAMAHWNLKPEEIKTGGVAS